MKITLERADLLKGLSHIQSVVERRNTIPILSNVLIVAEKGKVSFSATDMEIEVNEVVTASIVEPGSLTAPAHTMYEIVRKLPDGAQVELAATGSGQLVLSAGRSQFKLGCLPVGDFPKMPDGDYKHKFSLDIADLRVMIDRTRFAMSSEETRFYLNGIYLHSTAVDNVEVFRAVATDGHRLARVEMAAPKGVTGLAGIIVPRKTINEARKILDEMSGQVEIALSESKVRFTFDHIVITSKLIDGTFPDYERVIPQGNDKALSTDPRVFGAAVDRVATISSEKSRGVKLSLSEKQMILTANAPEAGSATEEMEVSYDGAPLDIGFNARYLMEVLQQIEGDGVRFMMADTAAPVIVQDVGDESALYVLMPMRV
ncbi:MAG: DNA polymerase III subunit beta [Proteobacteria bacterium]|jgi:DNA polymerase-3 subunit beta|nr:DNA polymerase III subunit beta [Alphaproteobacteria bacterium]NCC03776.1 DNA polymerase III subunit beta [Pseudomonadota bacterium]